MHAHYSLNLSERELIGLPLSPALASHDCLHFVTALFNDNFKLHKGYVFVNAVLAQLEEPIFDILVSNVIVVTDYSNELHIVQHLVSVLNICGVPTSFLQPQTFPHSENMLELFFYCINFHSGVWCNAEKH